MQGLVIEMYLLTTGLLINVAFKLLECTDVYVNEGSLYTFMCPFRADSNQLIYWNGPPDLKGYALGSDINPALKHKDRLNITGNTSNGEYNLQITNIQQSDEGGYLCYGVSGGDNKQQRYDLIIRAKPSSDPSIFSTPPGSVISGKTIQVFCEVIGGKPLAIITWECAGAFNEQNSSIDSKAVSSVQLTVNKTYDGKVCRCKALHPLWTSIKTVDLVLDVLYVPDTTPSIQQRPSGPLITGNNVTLTCTSSGGKPLSTLTWDCSGTLANNTSGNTASYSVELTVDKTYNNKTCTCFAAHPATAANITVTHTFTVYYAPDQIPSIQQSPTGPITDGNKVTLTCTVSGGNPLATLSWNCTGKSTNNTSENTASYSVELTVNKTYNNKICTCSATHYVSSYKPTIQHGLVVYYVPDTVPVIQQTPPGPIITGNVAKLTCTVSGGNPLATLYWNCTGTTTNNTSGNTASYSVELTVDKTYENKVCTCLATHYVSSYNLTVTHIFTVHYAPDTYPTIQQSPPGPIIAGLRVTLTCTVLGGMPLPMLTWDCNGTNTNNTFGNVESYSVEFTVDKTYNNRVCTCSATHPVLSYRPDIKHRLDVYYVPDTTPTIQQNPTGPITAGNKVTLTCTVLGGNPLAVLSWNCTGKTTNNTSDNTAAYGVELTVDKTYNNKICKCSASHYVSSYKPTIQHALIVYFAPDVVIHQNETLELVEGMDLILTCNAIGNPSTYTYHGWTQTFANTTVREFDKTKVSAELTLSSVSYMDIGNYTCFVDNTISDIQNKTIQSASTFISVKFKPVFLDYAKIYSAKIDSNLTTSIKLFSYPDVYKPVIWINESDNSIIGNGSDLFVALTRTLIWTQFYNAHVSVDTFSYESVLQLTRFQLNQQGLYTLHVHNSFSNNNLTIRIVVSDRPQSPKHFSVKALSGKTVHLFWIAGFNGGNPQTFTVTYGKINTIENVSIHTEEKSNSDEYEIIISDLIPSTTYIFTITSSNSEGAALSENNTLVVVTSSLEVTSEQSITGLVVGGLSGVLVATLVVTGIICYIRKTKGKEKEHHARTLTHSGNLSDDDDMRDNILYESSDQIIRDKLDTGGVEYASVNKDKTNVCVNKHTLQETSFHLDVKEKTKFALNGRNQKGNFKGTNVDEYENMEHAMPTTKSIGNQKVVNRNKDGLQYAELVFHPGPNGSKFVIRGIEDRTIYATVDTTQNIDPLPDSDDEDIGKQI